MNEVQIAWRCYMFACMDMIEAHLSLKQEYCFRWEVDLVEAQNKCHYYAELLFGYALLEEDNHES